MSIKAGVLVTGTEVLTGIITDRNGGWISDQLMDLGIDHRKTVVVSDDTNEIISGLSYLTESGCDLIVTTGGLGPTADDLTVAAVAQFCGRKLELDPALNERITEILIEIRSRYMKIDSDAVAVSTRKQATVPVDSEILDPVGTAPGVVVTPLDRPVPVVVVLPGPPSELQAMWPAATATEAFSALLTNTGSYSRAILRLYGMPESELAKSLREIEAEGCDLSALRITTCLRRGELEIATRYEREQLETYRQFEAGIRKRHGNLIFSDDGRTVDQIVRELLQDQTVACAESCTGGLLSARLTETAGSSRNFLGGLICYADAAKIEAAKVPPFLIERFGAVSVEVAAVLADGALEVMAADYGIGITGIAGPDGGTDEKPVGTVCISVTNREGGRISRKLALTGGRSAVRDRSTTAALQLLRRSLLEPTLVDIQT